MVTPAAPHVIWTEFSPNRKASGVRHATGYPIEVLEHAWDKYGSALIRAVYRYPGFEVIARARDRRKLGKFVAIGCYGAACLFLMWPQALVLVNGDALVLRGRATCGRGAISPLTSPSVTARGRNGQWRPLFGFRRGYALFGLRRGCGGQGVAAWRPLG